MILQNGSQQLLHNLTNANPIAKEALSRTPRHLVERAQIVLLMSEMGESIGYLLFSHDKEPEAHLANALYGLWIDPIFDQPYGKVLGDLIRSLRLSAVLVRSDDAQNIKEFLHYPLEYYHLAQAYRVNPTGDNLSLDKGESRPASSNRSSSTPGSIDIPLLVDPNRLERIYRLTEGNKTLATVEVYEGDDPSYRYLYPSVAPQLRRQGYGLEGVTAVADLLYKKGITCYLPIDPTDDAARRFAQQAPFSSAFDYLRVTPRFHLPPYPVPEEEPLVPRRRRRKNANSDEV